MVLFWRTSLMVLALVAFAPAQNPTPDAPSPVARNLPATSDVRTGNGLEQDAPPRQQATPQLPDAPSTAVRLTTHQKFETFVKRTYSPYTFASAATNATWAQMWGGYYEYGGGMQGWGKRFGASLANTEIRTFFSSFALPVIFRQDPRYHPSNKQGVFPRAWYAGTRVLVTRSDDNREMFNYSQVLGVLFTSSVQNSYYPNRDRGLSETMTRFVGGMGSDATANVLREFSPDLKRFARKIIPKKAQNLEKRIPEPVRQGVGIALQ